MADITQTYTNATISSITLPSNNTYSLKDENMSTVISQVNSNTSAIAALGKPLTYVVSSSAATTPAGYKYATSTNGTLAAAATQEGKMYLVPAAPNNGESGSYLEVICVNKGTSASPSWVWEQIGTTATDLSEYQKSADVASDVVSKVTVTHSTKSTDKALGEATTFAVTNSAVTVTPATAHIQATATGTAVGVATSTTALTGLGTASTDEALGVNATFTTSVTPSTAHIKATASGGGYSAPTATTDFVKSYPGAFNKLTTTSVTGTNGTVDVPNVTSAGSASSWSFTVTGETLTIGGGNGTAPTLGTAIKAAKVADSATTVATGGLSATSVTTNVGGQIMTGLGTASTGKPITALGTFTAPTVALATNASAVTTGATTVQVATGITSASTSVNANDKVTAVTGYANPSTDTFAQTVSVTAQPTIALNTVASAVTTGAKTVDAVTGITSAALNSTGITVGTNDKVTVITEMNAPSLSVKSST